MAKQGRIQREQRVKNVCDSVKEKREKMVARLLELEAKKRGSEDSKVVADCSREIFTIMHYLQSKRSSSYVRHRNRCEVTGRTRGYIGVFKMCRGVIRHLVSFGLLNGVKKTSHS